MTIKLGQEVVAMSLGSPVRCNAGAHPCRFTVSKLTATKAYGMMGGKLRATDIAGVVSVTAAKAMYRATLEKHNTDAAKVAKLVNEL